MFVGGGLWVPMLCRGIGLVDTTAEKGFSTVGVTYQTVCTSWVGEKVLQDGAVNMASPEPFLQ